MSKLEPTRTCSNPTATERIRAMLDERGVEWRERVWGGKHSVTTFWHARGVRWHYRENRFGDLRLHADGLAPEQAIAATLGSCNCSNNCTNSERTGTCHITPWKMERDTGFFDCMECSECGYVTDVSEWAKATYCAGCGRRIEQ